MPMLLPFILTSEALLQVAILLLIDFVIFNSMTQGIALDPSFTVQIVL